MLNERELSVLPRATVSTSEFCLRTLTVIVFRLKLLTPDCEAMADSDKTDFQFLCIYEIQKILIKSREKINWKYEDDIHNRHSKICFSTIELMSLNCVKHT